MLAVSKGKALQKTAKHLILKKNGNECHLNLWKLGRISTLVASVTAVTERTIIRALDLRLLYIRHLFA
jgi:hypothetical protein